MEFVEVPPLRFPEFTDEWKTYKVSDVLDFYSTNSLSWDQLEYSDGELRNLHYGLIHVGLPTLVNLKDDLLPTIKEGNTPKNYTLCLNGDVAFADASVVILSIVSGLTFPFIFEPPENFPKESGDLCRCRKCGFRMN